MGEAKPIRVTQHNVAAFLHEFDTVVSDCDGVIWTPLRSIPGAKEGFERLRDEGKRVFFVTNNSAQQPTLKFEKIGFPIAKDEVVHPAVAIAYHLQRAGFDKKAYVLAGESFRDHLREVGVAVVPEQRNEPVPENLSKMLEMIRDEPDIGAVIVDIDLNVSYLELTRAVHYLRQPDCLFFTGATDKFVPIVPDKTFIGPGYIAQLIEEISRRQSVVAGKPGPMMVQEYIVEHHHVDLKRSIFVGDTLLQDMGVANACGMKKLLVLSGVAKLEDLDACDPALVPDYYIESMGELARLLVQHRASL